ncbi:hypothetical protein HAX54_036757, partial [Datura stramonium]|nr:hypothetical protein [Datura stramonium]
MDRQFKCGSPDKKLPESKDEVRDLPSFRKMVHQPTDVQQIGRINFSSAKQWM